MDWNEVKDKFRQIVKGYEGEITEFPQSIDITLRKEGTEYSVYTQKLCVGIVLGAIKRQGSTEIGKVDWDFTEELLVNFLESYGFKKKKAEQLSMFDM